jgi:hypothetical protein
MIHWYEKALPPDECRKRADRCEALAKAADRDGDFGHASEHRREASEWREMARQKEITPQ